jgi:primosomal protein N' (replication factor Y) (superfamily II helicase)
MEETKVCQVCIPNTYSQVYDYEIQAPYPPVGTRIAVSFRQQERMGVVWHFLEKSNTDIVLKKISATTEQHPILDANMMMFCRWLSEYYHAPLSEILALAIPKWVRDLKRPLTPLTTPWIVFRQMVDIPAKLKKLGQFQDILSVLGEIEASCLKSYGISKAQIEQAIKLGCCEYVLKNKTFDLSKAPESLTLHPEQQAIVDNLNVDKFNVNLIQGVTGSGKTEVYIELMKKVFARGEQVLLLVPEIGLTASLFERLQARLAVPMVLFHSSLTDKQRYEHWLQAYHGQAQLIVGTRSAVFAPMPKLGLIIIDEEHDSSFKQMDGIRYSAKDAAIVRAKLHDRAIILGTATPSLETYQNVLDGKYQRYILNQKALSSTPLQHIVVDLRAQSTQHGLSQQVLQQMAAKLQDGQQVLVFMNRRGYSPLLFCHDCGWVQDCHQCDAHMTLHRKSNCVVCHHCGMKASVPAKCLQCASHQLMPLGVGTEQLYDFLTQYFSTFRTLRFDRDVVKNRKDLESNLKKIAHHEVDIIVGTQMLAKGHHFPHLSLVVMVDGDSGFYQTDFRALERLGQMYTQVAGRAGRARIPGAVMIQTHLPHHPLLNMLLQDGYESFIQALLKQREEAFLPPFAYLALVRVQGKKSLQVQQFLSGLMQKTSFRNLQVLGPAPAPMEKKAGLFRWQLMFKAHKRSHLHQQLQSFLNILQAQLPKGLRWFVEIDPYDGS